MEVAIHGNGTYDHDKKQWKVRTKKVRLSATIAQLSRAFKSALPNDESLTRPYWRKYLKAYRNYLARQQGPPFRNASRPSSSYTRGNRTPPRGVTG